MQTIANELFARSCYTGMLWFGLCIVVYLKQGIQLEYIWATFQNHHQAVWFFYDSFLDWSPAMQCNRTGVFSVGHIVSTDNDLHLHQSKSWGVLNLACVMYFYPINVGHVDDLLFHAQCICLLGFICMQTYALLSPGWLGHWKWALFMLHGYTLTAIAGFPIALFQNAITQELAIETLDSELQTNQININTPH